MSLIRKLRRIYTEDRVMVQMQNNINEVLDGLRLSAIIDGNVISGDLVVGGTAIPHNLGRVPQGWVVADKTANEDIWRVSWDKTFITLDTTADQTASFWVF